MNAVLAILAGFALWSVLWLGGNPVLARLFPGSYAEGKAITNSTLLLSLLLFSVIISLAAGFLTGQISTADNSSPQLILGGLLLLVGVFFQSQSWSLMPLWYHLIILALLIPASYVGASLA